MRAAGEILRGEGSKWSFSFRKNRGKEEFHRGVAPWQRVQLSVADAPLPLLLLLC